MTTTRTVAYVRVSTERQAEHGVSLEAQQAKIEAYARLYDLELVGMEVDAGVSAKTLDRPGLQRALAMLEKGEADALLVVKLDRLTRSVRDLGELVERYFAAGRWSLMSIGETIDTRSAAGRLVLNVLASVAQWEREATGERTSAAMRHMASEGQFIGGRAPFGFSVGPDGRLAPIEAEQAVITEARRLHAAQLPLRAIAAELDRQGMRSRTGRTFAAQQVKRMVA